MIDVQRVRKSYQKEGDALLVLSVEELRIERGERVALVGPSGVGKTTLLHILAGLVVPDEGAVEVNGTNLLQLSESQRDRFRAETCGCVFQKFHLLDGFSALENVELGAAFAGRSSSSSQARTLLEQVGLAERIHHQPSELSVGQQARVALARALINQPAVLLADEPTGALDSASAESVLSLMQEMAENLGTTLVCVTHDLEVAGRLQRTIALGAPQ